MRFWGLQLWGHGRAKRVIAFSINVDSQPRFRRLSDLPAIKVPKFRVKIRGFVVVWTRNFISNPFEVWSKFVALKCAMITKQIGLNFVCLFKLKIKCFESDCINNLFALINRHISEVNFIFIQNSRIPSARGTERKTDRLFPKHTRNLYNTPSFFRFTCDIFWEIVNLVKACFTLPDGKQIVESRDESTMSRSVHPQPSTAHSYTLVVCNTHVIFRWTHNITVISSKILLRYFKLLVF